jgi:hypothetical protein
MNGDRLQKPKETKEYNLFLIDIQYLHDSNL